MKMSAMILFYACVIVSTIAFIGAIMLAGMGKPSFAAIWLLLAIVNGVLALVNRQMMP